MATMKRKRSEAATMEADDEDYSPWDFDGIRIKRTIRKKKLLGTVHVDDGRLWVRYDNDHEEYIDVEIVKNLLRNVSYLAVKDMVAELEFHGGNTTGKREKLRDNTRQQRRVHYGKEFLSITDFTSRLDDSSDDDSSGCGDDDDSSSGASSKTVIKFGQMWQRNIKSAMRSIVSSFSSRSHRTSHLIDCRGEKVPRLEKEGAEIDLDDVTAVVQQKLGEGAHGVVLLCHSKNEGETFAGQEILALKVTREDQTHCDERPAAFPQGILVR